MRRRWMLVAVAMDGAFILFMLPIVIFGNAFFDELPAASLALGLGSLGVGGAAALIDWEQPSQAAWAAFVVAHVGLLASAWLYFDRTWFWLPAVPAVPLLASLCAWERSRNAKLDSC